MFSMADAENLVKDCELKIETDQSSQSMPLIWPEISYILCLIVKTNFRNKELRLNGCKMVTGIQGFFMLLLLSNGRRLKYFGFRMRDGSG